MTREEYEKFELREEYKAYKYRLLYECSIYFRGYVTPEDALILFDGVENGMHESLKTSKE